MIKRRWVLMALALGLTGSVGTITAPPAQALRLISESQEKQMGAEAARQIEAEYGVVRDRRENALVQQIGKKLARVSDRPDLPWTFKILNNKEINAVSLPGGYVYVFQGLMDAVGNDRDMLAGVIAHEVGHVAARHHVEMAEKQMAGSFLINLLFSGKTRNLAGLFSNIYSLHWSREDEYEADKLGVKYAAKAGYDPSGLPEFLEVLVDKYGSGATSGPQSWLQTHPANSERVKRAYAYAREYGGASARTQSGTRSRYGASSAPDLLGGKRR